MLKGLKKLLRTTLLGGIGIVLPLVIIIVVFTWVYELIVGLIRPLSRLLSDESRINLIVADIITFAIIIALCFIIGIIVRTRVGRYFHNVVEGQVLNRIPLYSATRDVVKYISGENKTPFLKVVMIRPFGNDLLVTGFITDMSEKAGYATIFAPTGPNPTTGLIYHVPKDQVLYLDTKVETGVKSIIGCGAGSKSILDDYQRLHVAKPA